MKDNGDFTDDEWATIYGAGGASPVPSFLSDHYSPRRFHPYPTAVGSWLLALGAFFAPVLAVIAVPLAVWAALRGNRLAWLAAAVAVGCAAGGYLVLWSPG